jgi:DNA polymerase-3 subunit gamma/tau
VATSQGIIFEDDALHIIAQKADGAMRDALSIFFKSSVVLRN